MSFLTGLRLRELNSWKISPMFLVGFVFCFVFSFKHGYCCWHFRTPKARTRDSCSSCRKSLSKCNRAGGNLEDHSVHAHTPRQDHPHPCLLFLTDSSNFSWSLPVTEARQSPQAVCAMAALLHILGRKDDYSLQCCSSLWAPKTIMLPPLSNLFWLKNLGNLSLQGMFSSPVLWWILFVFCFVFVCLLSFFVCLSFLGFFCSEEAFEETVWALYIFIENQNLEVWLLANLNTKWQPRLVFTIQCLFIPLLLLTWTHSPTCFVHWLICVS